MIKYVSIIRSLAIFFIALTIGLFISKKNKISKEKLKSRIEVKIKRLDKELYNCKSFEDVLILIKNNSKVFYNVYKLADQQTDEELAQEIFKFISREEIKDFMKEVLNTFENISVLERDFEEAFINLKKIMGNFPSPNVSIVFTGMKDPYIIDKEDIIISIDFFLPETSKYRPSHYPDYLKKIYSKEYVSSQAMLQYVQQFLSKSKEENLLSYLLYYGKVLYFLKKIFPNKEDYIILSLPKGDLKEMEINEVYIWEFIKDSSILYNKSPQIITPILEYGSKCDNIYEGCPGGVGLFIGYKILLSYIKSNKIPLEKFIEDLNVASDTEILFKSNYKPYC